MNVCTIVRVVSINFKTMPQDLMRLDRDTCVFLVCDQIIALKLKAFVHLLYTTEVSILCAVISLTLSF